MAVRRCKKQDLKRIAKATGGICYRADYSNGPFTSAFCNYYFRVISL
jgi:hypothetical protein